MVAALEGLPPKCILSVQEHHIGHVVDHISGPCTCMRKTDKKKAEVQIQSLVMPNPYSVDLGELCG